MTTLEMLRRAASETVALAERVDREDEDWRATEVLMLARKLLADVLTYEEVKRGTK